jgi:hypothetical protein
MSDRPCPLSPFELNLDRRPRHSHETDPRHVLNVWPIICTDVRVSALRLNRTLHYRPGSGSQVARHTGQICRSAAVCLTQAN